MTFSGNGTSSSVLLSCYFSSAVFLLGSFLATFQRKNQYLALVPSTLTFDPTWVVLKVQRGENQKGLMTTLRDIQQFLGVLFSIYGFFVAVSPDKYTIPYLNDLLPTITVQQQGVAGILLLAFGLYLLWRTRSQ